MSRRRHWERVYQTKSPEAVSWYQSQPTLSLDLIEAIRVTQHERERVLLRSASAPPLLAAVVQTLRI